MDWNNISFDIWLETGIRKGWVGAPICHTHDGLPMSLPEEEAFEEGDDICIHVLRLYESDEQRLQVEANHSPSQWRKSNLNL